MEQVKITDLIKLLKAHLDKYGDSPVMILDERNMTYKTFTESHISRMPGNTFVIECEIDNEF